MDMINLDVDLFEVLGRVVKVDIKSLIGQLGVEVVGVPLQIVVCGFDEIINVVSLSDWREDANVLAFRNDAVVGWRHAPGMPGPYNSADDKK
ncbi:hypothetical protein CCAX7_20390 [Capsulimonas corticalis]|uniref:Uncharacterized protein n=1 Tax=Capsulimonas corticalis TaxID=2219043 RepID=A0A402D2D3_9BACT|nr:hypothetical protein CCAX7_20390 [Capsulimonas corticalis]